MRDLPAASRSQKLPAPPSWLRRPPRGGPTALHDELGNRGVQSLIHRKNLRIGSAQDPVEKEADRMAEKAVASLGQRPIAVDERSGRLEPETRLFFESRFGRDLGDVRVHTAGQSARSAEAVGARAFTAGEDIVFGEREYAPESEEGRHLLAHELAHVAQHRDGGPSEPGVIRRQPAGKGPAGPPKPWVASEQIDTGLMDPSGCWSSETANGNIVSATGNDLYSVECPGGVCASRPLPQRLLFHVDSDKVPRPGTFSPTPGPGTWQPPVLSAFVTFNPAGGGVTNVVMNATGTGTYAGPGVPLQTTFGSSIPFTPPGLGTIFIVLSNADPSSGEVAIYVDTLPVVFCQAPPRPNPSSPGHPTPYWVTPDPNSRSGYRTLGGPFDPGWDWGQPAPIQLWEDEDGYFFWESGEKHRLGTELP